MGSNYSFDLSQSAGEIGNVVPAIHGRIFRQPFAARRRVAQVPGSRVHVPQRVKISVTEGEFETDKVNFSEFQTWVTRPEQVSK